MKNWLERYQGLKKEKIIPYRIIRTTMKVTLQFHFRNTKKKYEEIPSGNYSLIMHFNGCLNDDNESIFKNSYVNSKGYKMWVNSEHNKIVENMHVLSHKTLYCLLFRFILKHSSNFLNAHHIFIFFYLLLRNLFFAEFKYFGLKLYMFLCERKYLNILRLLYNYTIHY